MSFVDVFVGNYIVIDFELYHLWLTGRSLNECCVALQQRGVLQSTGARYEELVSDTKDSFRLFANIEQLLKWPTKFGEQHLYQIDPVTQRNLIENYYKFDDVVIREILGRKLSTKNRNNLDDVSDKTRIPLRSCCRQFDNVKRVFKTVEEMPGSLERNIKTHFCIMSDELAKKYAAIVFMANHRFETGKKRLSHLTFDDFLFCTEHMIVNWSYSAAECDNHEDMDVDLDRMFLQELRDLKILTEKEFLDEHRNYLMNSLKTSLTKKKLTDLDDNFKNLSKAIISIAYGLNHSKEVKNYFVDVVEKVIEPFMMAMWSEDDMVKFLNLYKDSGLRLSVFRTLPNMVTVWERYMNTFNKCCLKLYHN
ncbi:acidic fibroblast growth factor intracellular-binding protein-like [Ruditapes philippinarum]|uniref:acidic fibroblast growth factor intracellular-binding protein-like n=1 Tax=Ruditapes philippinarum TaxID=129788 RepID=UPI00295BE6E2|nr:acidic fibroblast growth factor intracellular-binding protein-like [Ruditapes philippinarum]XP_060590468.1 acidic fibroblast growth factor intracellular-binding protein-like [Ruditapes philippinarum]